eukprot:Pompholyxophrys_punicea_v1_NODE_579_length_1654_cov_3.593750.p1 type:complete len:100 gc:universal NODE_579_length_1654_cov_3.593750:1312-1611(+)
MIFVGLFTGECLQISTHMYKKVPWLVGKNSFSQVYIVKGPHDHGGRHMNETKNCRIEFLMSYYALELVKSVTIVVQLKFVGSRFDFFFLPIFVTNYLST